MRAITLQPECVINIITLQVLQKCLHKIWVVFPDFRSNKTHKLPEILAWMCRLLHYQCQGLFSAFSVSFSWEYWFCWPVLSQVICCSRCRFYSDIQPVLNKQFLWALWTSKDTAWEVRALKSKCTPSRSLFQWHIQKKKKNLFQPSKELIYSVLWLCGHLTYKFDRKEAAIRYEETWHYQNG